MGVCLRDLGAGGVRTASVRFYFDADILGLGKLLATLRSDVTYPGDPGGVLHKSRRPPCPITTSHTRDLDLSPVVARARWVAGRPAPQRGNPDVASTSPLGVVLPANHGPYRPVLVRSSPCR